MTINLPDNIENIQQCKFVIDQLILYIDGREKSTELSNKELVKLKNMLMKARNLLVKNKILPQKQIHTIFATQIRVVHDERERWAMLGIHFAKVIRFLARKLARENQ